MRSLALIVTLVGLGLSGPASADQSAAKGGPAPPPGWAVMAGASLKSTLEGWARASGWTVVWDNPVDYRLRASAAFPGGFEDAVGQLIDAIYQSNPELSVTLYRGNRVLHVHELGLTSN
jgi:hypothetical protein